VIQTNLFFVVVVENASLCSLRATCRGRRGVDKTFRIKCSYRLHALHILAMLNSRWWCGSVGLSGDQFLGGANVGSVGCVDCQSALNSCVE
jgi:hypothetical protein